VFASLGLTDPLAVETRPEQEGTTLEEIRAVIPEWPDTNGIPWQMCATCRVVYDPTSSRGITPDKASSTPTQ
jgi:hypothetical protein